EALDTHSGALVAIKSVEGVTSAEKIYRLKHEFRVLSDIDHPNLIRFGELVQEDQRWFFTMEVVRGLCFTAYVRPKDPGAASADTLEYISTLAPDAAPVIEVEENDEAPPSGP